MFDVMNWKTIAFVAERMRDLTHCEGLGAQEIGDLALSALQLILAWCDPLPVAAFVATKVSMEDVRTLVRMGTESCAHFGEPCEEIGAAIESALAEASERGDPTEMASVQDHFSADPRIVERFVGLFFGVLFSVESK